MVKFICCCWFSEYTGMINALSAIKEDPSVGDAIAKSSLKQVESIWLCGTLGWDAP